MVRILNDITKNVGIMISSKLDLNEELLTKTASMELNHKKNSAANFTNNIKMSEGEIVAPSICESLRIANDSCSNLILNSQVFYQKTSLTNK